MKAKYVHPYTNFGFRKLFGKESSKDLVKDFLNQLLPDQHRIVKITAIRSSEQWGVIKADCRFMFDIYCENEREDTFIVEIQKAKYSFFENRDEFYHSFP
ncbi:MAG: hypothetical protein GTO45_38460, partial [Candidatus Aminicenantes bacterium]|nr:hypothetical protein [Candidatus Aminicenantes bacterium]NIM84503.1 hypothetical protein [Candidatus Aminicenantes bacterium]NIN24028.1 hypothetical protein [Candidatus Aminicenantes bacterium]NIN47738.1 hypothetical protein [Candidatus Aminicenantes bacterium]NIN90672.1 hypothetical protein [Candidatus Aminicenantes bacterium]